MEHTKDKVQFGFWLYILSDCVLFAALFATYAVLQGATFGGATIYDITNVPFVFLETLLLLTSSFTIGLALVAASKHRATLCIALLLTTLLLGLTFLAMELHEFTSLVAEGSGPSRSAFLSTFFTLVGTHGLHVFFGSLFMVVVLVHIVLRGVEENMTKLMCLALFWHFLDIVWIFIFTFVYLFGALAM
jgi:cytochrome o ubiquinol oxidase subunit 3